MDSGADLTAKPRGESDIFHQCMLEVTVRLTTIICWISLLCLIGLSVPLLSVYGHAPVRLHVALAAAKQTEDRAEDVADVRPQGLNRVN